MNYKLFSKLKPIVYYPHNTTNNYIFYRNSFFLNSNQMNINILLAALVYLLGIGQSLKIVVRSERSRKMVLHF